MKFEIPALSIANLADDLVERVWERFDIDIVEDLDSENELGLYDAETGGTNPAYDALLLEFVSRLLDADGLAKAAALADARATATKGV